MMKAEFEALALRGSVEIGNDIYKSIESFYMRDDGYHAQFGGIHEGKLNFIKRVFGGKTNTPKTIAKKIADEANRSNRWHRSGIDPQILEQQETLIREHYKSLLEYGL